MFLVIDSIVCLWGSCSAHMNKNARCTYFHQTQGHEFQLILICIIIVYTHETSPNLYSDQTSLKLDHVNLMTMMQ